jgi:hypothetical protein
MTTTFRTEFRWRQQKVERLLADLRRVVIEERALEHEADGAAALEAKCEEAERLRWKIATAVKSAAGSPNH